MRPFSLSKRALFTWKAMRTLYAETASSNKAVALQSSLEKTLHTESQLSLSPQLQRGYGWVFTLTVVLIYCAVGIDLHIKARLILSTPFALSMSYTLKICWAHL